MTKRINHSPVALSAEGHVFLNLATLGGQTPGALLRDGIAERGDLFIGVRLSSPEVQIVMRGAVRGIDDAAAQVAGKREQRKRRRR